VVHQNLAAGSKSPRLHSLQGLAVRPLPCNYNVINIEVVDWEENVDDIMEVIGKKCKRAYPDHYLLLVSARHSGKVLDFDWVIEHETIGSARVLWGQSWRHLSRTDAKS
jgi:hypothetical protein